MNAFKDAGHLFRLAAVFLVGGLAFVGLRAFLVPKSFGQYGHYRGNAIAEIAARPVNYAGHQACEDCHADVLEKRRAASMCTSTARRATDHWRNMPTIRPRSQPAKLDTAVLCVRCHEANIAKPKTFPASRFRRPLHRTALRYLPPAAQPGNHRH